MNLKFLDYSDRNIFPVDDDIETLIHSIEPYLNGKQIDYSEDVYNFQKIIEHYFGISISWCQISIIESTKDSAFFSIYFPLSELDDKTDDIIHLYQCLGYEFIDKEIKDDSIYLKFKSIYNVKWRIGSMWNPRKIPHHKYSLFEYYDQLALIHLIPFFPGKDIATDIDLKCSVDVRSLIYYLRFSYHIEDIYTRFYIYPSKDYQRFSFYFHYPTTTKSTYENFIIFIDQLGYDLFGENTEDEMLYLHFKARYPDDEDNDIRQPSMCKYRCLIDNDVTINNDDTISITGMALLYSPYSTNISGPYVNIDTWDIPKTAEMHFITYDTISLRCPEPIKIRKDILEL